MQELAIIALIVAIVVGIVALKRGHVATPADPPDYVFERLDASPGY